MDTKLVGEIRKTMGATVLKATDDGHLVAKIAELNVIDKDGDVIEPGFIGSQPAPAVWGHDWREPLGPGKVYEDTLKGKKIAVGEADFLMDVPAIRDRFITVKGMGDQQEYSFGFAILNGGARLGEFEGQDVRFLSPRPDGKLGSSVHEWSPVLVGAGVDTQTIAAKSAAAALSALADGEHSAELEAMLGRLIAAASEAPKSYLEHIAATGAALQDLITRTVERDSLRRKDGRTLGDEALAALEALAVQLDSAKSSIEELGDDDTGTGGDDDDPGEPSGDDDGGTADDDAREELAALHGAFLADEFANA